jgi:hypothetical protein
MLHMLLWLYTHVSNICFKCFICFRRMLQMFHLDVLKVGLGGAHAAIVCCCCYVGHHMFQKYPACCCVGHRATWCMLRVCGRVTMPSAAVCVHAGMGQRRSLHVSKLCYCCVCVWAWVTVGHCMFQNYAAVAVAWITTAYWC